MTVGAGTAGRTDMKGRREEHRPAVQLPPAPQRPPGPGPGAPGWRHSRLPLGQGRAAEPGLSQTQHCPPPGPQPAAPSLGVTFGRPDTALTVRRLPGRTRSDLGAVTGKGPWMPRPRSVPRGLPSRSHWTSSHGTKLHGKEWQVRRRQTPSTGNGAVVAENPFLRQVPVQRRTCASLGKE